MCWSTPSKEGLLSSNAPRALFSPSPHLMVDVVTNVPPASLGRHEEGVTVEIGIIGSLMCLLH